jgi:hypothetical protein
MKREYCSIAWLAAQPSAEDIAQIKLDGLQDHLFDRDGNTHFGGGYLRYCGPDQEPAKLPAQQLHNTIAQLGREGWELVGYAAYTQASQTQLFWFKRPLEYRW